MIVHDFDTDIIISRDGSHLAFSGLRFGPRGATSALYWREAAEESFQFIPGTRGLLSRPFHPKEIGSSIAPAGAAPAAAHS